MSRYTLRRWDASGTRRRLPQKSEPIGGIPARWQNSRLAGRAEARTTNISSRHALLRQRTIGWGEGFIVEATIPRDINVVVHRFRGAAHKRNETPPSSKVSNHREIPERWQNSRLAGRAEARTTNIAIPPAPGHPFNSAQQHLFSQSARAQYVPAPELSFRFPRSGRPESPRLRHVPEKMRFRHGASPGRNDTCRYLSRARLAELTGYPAPHHRQRW